MAFKKQACILLFVSLFALSSIINTSHANGGIAIYWGQNNVDGALSDTCNTGNYEIVNLGFLNKFGCGRTPGLDFGGHCSDSVPCTKLQSEIVQCQRKGVKVFLSLGGPIGSYSLFSAQDAKNVATYLYNNFLTGQRGPLGSVTLDGIDFKIESGTNLYWVDLAKNLNALRNGGTYFYLSAAPQCAIPDYYLDKAIGTGLFDYIFVQFYNNPSCQYNGDTKLLFASWDSWTTEVAQRNTVFMGLPAGPDDAPNDGYIPPDEVLSQVCPRIRRTPNYGGVMLWNTESDVLSSYSEQIRSCLVSVRLLQTVTAV